MEQDQLTHGEHVRLEALAQANVTYTGTASSIAILLAAGQYEAFILHGTEAPE